MKKAQFLQLLAVSWFGWLCLTLLETVEMSFLLIRAPQATSSHLSFSSFLSFSFDFLFFFIDGSRQYLISWLSTRTVVQCWMLNCLTGWPLMMMMMVMILVITGAGIVVCSKTNKKSNKNQTRWHRRWGPKITAPTTRHKLWNGILNLHNNTVKTCLCNGYTPILMS